MANKDLFISFKSLLKSRTFWVGVLHFLGSYIAGVLQYMEVSATLSVSGLLFIAMRIITKQPIKFN